MENSSQIEVHYASPILYKPLDDLNMDDRITFAGRLCNERKENKEEECRVVGVCKVGDLGSYVPVDKCCFTKVRDNLTLQQAASLAFPMVMSYYILKNLLADMPGKTILFFHENEIISCVFAYIASSLDVNVVFLVKGQSNQERMMKFSRAVTEDEIANLELNRLSCLDLDAVCLLSKSSDYVSRQVMKYLKPGGSVITLNGNKNGKYNPFTDEKDIHYIMTTLEYVTEDSEVFSKLYDSCCSVLNSRGLLERLLNIPQSLSSIYELVLSNNSFKEKSSQKDYQTESCLRTISFKPENAPQEVQFYKLPLDSNGFKEDRTYLVIGGIRGFGFEVARWMVENGAKTVMCTARSAPSNEKKLEVQRLEQETGSRILLRQADVTSWKDMNVIKEELESLPAVAGIVFTAMVLEDQLLTQADLKTCSMVVGTKVKGTLFGK